jgi:DNA polymerase-3 subunit epsilon
MLDFAAIDFETANRERSSVCSVGLVIVENGEIADSYYHLIRPIPNYYDIFTTRVHGLTFADTTEAPTFPEVWADVALKIRHLPLVAHNKAFDESCLKAVFRAYGLEYPNYKFLCTLIAAKHRWKRGMLENFQLQTVAQACGYDLTNHHHALADAQACAAIAKKIL